MAHLASAGDYAGRILIADDLKADAVEAIRALYAKGIETAMLTGDSRSVADDIAKALDLDQYEAELLPEDKVRALEVFLQRAS